MKEKAKPITKTQDKEYYSGRIYDEQNFLRFHLAKDITFTCFHCR